MKKLNKQYYYSPNGERKVNCYHITISKSLLQQTSIKEDDELQMYAKDDKIVIEKVR